MQNYVSFTARHFHQRIGEHRYSAISKHLQTQNDNKRAKIDQEMQKQVRLPNIQDAVYKGQSSPLSTPKVTQSTPDFSLDTLVPFFLLFVLSYFCVLYP